MNVVFGFKTNYKCFGDFEMPLVNYMSIIFVIDAADDLRFAVAHNEL